MDAVLTQLADYVTAFRPADLPAAVIHEAKRRIVDTLGCGIAAFDAEPCRIARAIALRTPVPDGAPVLGTAAHSLPDLAAFANATMTRYLDGNDCYPGGGGHPSDAVAPLLALAEAERVDGTVALAAIVLAYELHHALFHSLRLIDKGLDHVFYVAVATAAGAAKLQSLDRTRTANAIALAVASFLPLEAVRHGQLSMWKGGSAGFAARVGLFAAALAQAGMTGPAEVFEGRHGLRELIGNFTALRLTEPGGRYRILEADMKCLAAEYHAQGPILAALKLRRELAVDDAAKIAAVTISGYAHAVKNIGSGAARWRPTTRESADHSLPYMVAAVLVDGAFHDGIFDPARFRDSRILALADRITVQEDPELTQRFPGSFPCRVEITRLDGTRRTAAIDNPPGHHDRPMSDDEVVAKFQTLAVRQLGDEKLGRALDRVWALDRGALIADIFEALVVA